MSANRFAHLKAEVLSGEPAAEPIAEPPAQPIQAQSVQTQPLQTQSTPVQPDDTPSVSPQPTELSAAESLELQELGQLVERRVGILGRIPASLKDEYDQMLLRARKYIGRPNADVALQAWVELTLEDDTLQRRWLKRMQDLRRS